MTKSKKESVLKYDQKDCPICLEEILIERKSLAIPCSHSFCIQCIGKWLCDRDNCLCPLCKQKIKHIAYDVKSGHKFSKINFPKAFTVYWNLLNMVFDLIKSYENLLNKCFLSIKFNNNFYNEKIKYLIYFGDIKICTFKLNEFREKKVFELDSIKEEILKSQILFPSIIHLLTDRLKMIFDDKIVKLHIENCQKEHDSLGIDGVYKYIKKVVDPSRGSKLEIELAIKCHNIIYGDLIVEYYSESDIDCTKILFSGEDPSTCTAHIDICSAIFSKFVCAIGVLPDWRHTIGRMEYLNQFMNKYAVIYPSSLIYNQLGRFIQHVLENSAQFQLLLTGFYPDNHLINCSVGGTTFDISRTRVTKPMAEFVKYQINKTQLDEVVALYFDFHKTHINNIVHCVCSCIHCLKNISDEKPLNLSDDSELVIIEEYMTIESDAETDDLQIISVDYGQHIIEDDDDEINLSRNSDLLTSHSLDQDQLEVYGPSLPSKWRRISLSPPTPPISTLSDISDDLTIPQLNVNNNMGIDSIYEPSNEADFYRFLSQPFIQQSSSPDNTQQNLINNENNNNFNIFREFDETHSQTQT